MDNTVSVQLANSETIRYADDTLETYETQVTRMIYELMAAQAIKMVDVRQRLAGCDEVNM